LTVEQNLDARQWYRSVHRTDQRRLSVAVRPEQCDDLTLAQLE